MKSITATLLLAFVLSVIIAKDVTIAVATFTGPLFLGQFNFYQGDDGQVTATDALHQGLQENRNYRFKFYSVPNCEELGKVVLEHRFKSMQVLNMGGTSPIQESIKEAHLRLIDSPWVLADENQNLACVMLKKVTE